MFAINERVFLRAGLLGQNFDTVPKFRSIFNTLQSTNQLPCSVLDFEEHPSTPTHLHSYCTFKIVELRRKFGRLCAEMELKGQFSILTLFTRQLRHI